MKVFLMSEGCLHQEQILRLLLSPRSTQRRICPAEHLQSTFVILHSKTRRANITELPKCPKHAAPFLGWLRLQAKDEMFALQKSV